MKFTKCRSDAHRILAITALVFTSVNTIANSQTHSEKTLTCKQADSEIFSSEATNIEAFDASQYGAVLVQVMPIPDANLNLYIFNPGEIICAIKADEDTSSVSL